MYWAIPSEKFVNAYICPTLTANKKAGKTALMNLLFILHHPYMIDLE
jgi:hypothetical protein